MSRGKWLREPVTGLPYRQFNQIDEAFLVENGTDHGALNTECDLLADRDIYNQRSAAWLGCDWVDVARIEEAMVADPNYPWRLITDVNSNVIARATHSNTATHWGMLRATASRDTQLRNLKPFRIAGAFTPDED